MYGHLWIDDLLVAVERRHDPALRDRPIVVGGRPGSAGRVVAASPEAIARGVVLGQSLDEAHWRCPDAAFLPGVLARVLEATALIDEAIRDVAGAASWSGVDQATVSLPVASRDACRDAERVRARVEAVTGYRVACGVARTWVAARVAAAMARPGGLVHVLPGYERRFVQGADLEHFPFVDAPQLGRLRALGWRRVGDLAALPAAMAHRVLRQSAHVVCLAAAGEGPLPAPPGSRPRRLCRQVWLPEEEGVAESLLRDVLGSLARDLSGALRRAGCRAHAITLRVEGCSGESLARWRGFPAPAGDARDLLRALEPLLAPLVAQVASPRLLSVVAEQLTSLPANEGWPGARPRRFSAAGGPVDTGRARPAGRQGSEYRTAGRGTARW